MEHNCNENYNLFTKVLKDIMDDISPIEQVRISGKCRYVEPWMTRGLEVSQKTKETLYKNSLMKNSTNLDRAKYINYRNTYNKVKQKLKISYYTQRIVDCKWNTKELWKTINAIICKHKHSGSVISYITIEGVRTYNPLKIAKAFGKFYSTLGSTLAKQINPGVNMIDYYLSKIPCNMNSMVMHPTTQNEVEQIISKLPNKASHGHNMISNKLLKSLGKSISLPLTYIFNQSIAQGIFPDQMKIAEVVPLCKGKSTDELINYRPILLLLTMSKLLEKVIYKHLIKFTDKYKIIYESHYGFHSKRSCEHAMLELIGKIFTK